MENVTNKRASAPMSSAVYDALADSKLLRDVECAFCDATGLALKLVRSGKVQRRLSLGRNASAFCALMNTNGSACAACLEVRREIQNRLCRKLAPQEVCCFAGLTDLAVPVIVGGQHVATLLSGQVFRQKPARRQFDRVIRQLREWGMRDRLSELKRAYFQTPVVSEEKLRGAMRLLSILATQLAESANRHLLVARNYEPPSMIEAKNFVRAHAHERLTLRQVAEHVRANRHYFYRVFKRNTGITLTEFLARVRVERAKNLLCNPRLRITNVAENAGFNSISQFNRVFRRYAGNSPTAYRTALLGSAGMS
jgi:AraC-like DNA-binding protein